LELFQTSPREFRNGSKEKKVVAAIVVNRFGPYTSKDTTLFVFFGLLKRKQDPLSYQWEETIKLIQERA